MKTWLVLDCHYLCHRVFHTTRHLSWGGSSTGVIFGFLKSISHLKDEFQTDRVAFCFEHPHLLRKDIYPTYKHRRHSAERSVEEIKAYKELAFQIQELRTRYLPEIGFRNIFCYDGFESDDIMAAIAKSLPDDEDAILVTSDADLLQCLRHNVTIYCPQSQQIWTRENFIATHGLPPKAWAKVKAIAGCHTDQVEGIKGVGETSALKFLKGQLPQRTLQWKAITSVAGLAVIERNKRLVKLPFEGCPEPRLVEDKIDLEGWRRVCGRLGMKSIAGKPPVATRRMI